MVTGLTLDDQWFADEFQWWIGSVPPYYCYNAPVGTSNDDLSTDDVWLGTSFTVGVANAPTQYTNGVKFALVNPISFDNPANAIKYKDNSGQQQTLLTLSSQDPALNPYSPPAQYLQSTYKIGNKNPGGDPMFFGPYNLNLTDSTVVDGDIIFITTGSDVIGGGLEDGAVPLDTGDNRSFNLIFYSTGSSDVTTLSEWVGHPNQTGRGSGGSLINYNKNTRQVWYSSTGVGGFVGIRSQSDVNNVLWWPLCFNDQDTNVIDARNDS